MTDMTAARRTMVDSQLRPQGVTDPNVLRAFLATPREDHVPAAARDVAYLDRSVPTEQGRAMMPPAALGRLLSEAAPRAGERALVVAPSSTYAAALLGAMGLAVETADTFDARGSYDLVLVDGAVEVMPDSVAHLLTDGGRIVAPLFDRGVSRLAIGHRVGKSIAWRSFVDADVAPIPALRAAPAFTF